MRSAHRGAWGALRLPRQSGFPVALCIASLLALGGATPARANPEGGAADAALPPAATAGATPRRPAKTVHDILTALDSQPVNAAKLAPARKTLDTPPPPDLAGQALADFHFVRAQAALELGLVGAQIQELRRVIELGGGSDPHRAWAELGGAEFQGGNFRSAIAAKEKALQLTPANMKGFTLTLHSQLSDMYSRLGDFETAKRHMRDAEALMVVLKRSPAWPNYQYMWQAGAEEAYARIEYYAGHYAEAEARFRRALDYREKDLVQNQERIRLKQVPPSSHIHMENHRHAAQSWLSSTLLAQGRLREAEVLSRDLAYRMVKERGQEGVHTNMMMNSLVQVLLEQNRVGEALQLVERMQRNFDKLGLSTTAYPYAVSRRNRANALAALRRGPEAIAEYEALQAALAADPQLSESLGAPTLGWVSSLLASKRIDEAVSRSERLAQRLEAQMGPQAYQAAEARGYHGAALAAAGKLPEALDSLRASVTVLISAAAAQADRGGRRFQRLSYIIENYLAVLARVRGTALEKARGIDASAEAFLVADALRGQSVQQAMAASALRAAAGTPELANLVRQEQDVRQEREALFKILAELMSRPADQLLPQVIADMRRRTVELDTRHRSLTGEIQRRFPDFADLAAPRPATISQIQAVLRPGEALLSVLPTQERTFVWAVPASGPAAFAAVDLPRAKAAAQVNTLREAVDPKDFDVSSLPAFDGVTAHRLYQQLLEPVKPGWAGARHLIVAAGGAFSRLPFSLLLSAPAPAATKAAISYSEYRDWPWLAKETAVSQLPAASSLLTLRRMKAGNADRLAFAGFGDPDFGGTASVGGNPARGARAVRAAALPEALRREAKRSDDTGSVDYSAISPLPDTRDEILALAKALNADPQRDVFLGREASRAKVLSTDLARRRVVAFATHGLLAGEYPGVNQPALALANPGGGQNGLLTLDDILGLKLDADWVVLSACNTAGGDGEGGEAVSGLGRGFFYAGSRSLLVTHWPVESVSAKQLVVGAFDAIAADPAVSRAEALRRSMLAMMARNEGKEFSYAHPLFWAPYALVGDGGR